MRYSTIGLVANPLRPEATQCASSAEKMLREKGCIVVYPHESKSDAENTVFPQPECIITFGGDGTLLIGARIAMKYQIPLLGINLGTVGFLTEEQPEHLAQTLDRLLRGDFAEEERSLLQVTNLQTCDSWTALNDAVITRGGYARLIRMETQVNGQSYGTFTADGLIAATPTGSTGYSLSAGGPIVEPQMDCMILTPVCAHSLAQRPCIVSGRSVIDICLQPDRSQTAELQIDGLNRGSLKDGDRVRIALCSERFRLIRMHPYDFFGLVRTKLNEWGSIHA